MPAHGPDDRPAAPEPFAPEPAAAAPASAAPDGDPTDAVVRSVLGEARRIAVVGASPDPSRASHEVMGRLLDRGYDVVPVHPTATQVHGRDVVPSLADVTGPIDVVDVFLRPERTPAIAREAVAVGAGALWLQLGIRSDEAAAIARSAGVRYVEDRCLGVEVDRAAAHRPTPPPT